jgi:hypothetical protein
MLDGEGSGRVASRPRSGWVGATISLMPWSKKASRPATGSTVVRARTCQALAKVQGDKCERSPKDSVTLQSTACQGSLLWTLQGVPSGHRQSLGCTAHSVCVCVCARARARARAVVSEGESTVSLVGFTKGL